MANKPKKPVVDPRRARIDELRTQQKSSERKRTFILVGVAVVVGLAIIGAAAVPLIQRSAESNRAISEFGVAASAAGCGDVIDDPPTGVSDHVGPGSLQPQIERVEYDTAPPSAGQHFVGTAGFDRDFYTRDDAPQLENLVHNLEHGYTIVWYDESVEGAELDTLEALAGRISADTPKFIVTAWDSEDRGEFAEGSIAISHWSTDAGRRQYCDQVSGEAIADFVEQFPSSDSPEPNAI